MEKDNVLAEDSKVKGSEALPSCDNLAGVVTIIGTGLIGGSFALVLKDKELVTKIIGVDNNKEHQEKALELGIVDEVFPLDEAIAKSKLIVLAVPVDALASLLPAVLDRVGN
ncbi:MAG TPA: prephenate dehydrogenase/arogenate dehydrogenase family protein, partial [Segetibacter sp.]|nr:prephenate dehydrogenase/arogenate dehydrogenase family protein [Segetibacter sp.]